MANNQTHLVSPELAQNAQFKSIHAIPTNHLQAGDVIQVLPGTYDDPRTSNVADVTIVGMGNAKDVIFTGFSIPTAMAAGANVIIKNCKINTPGAIIGNTASTTTFIDCIFDGTSGNAILPSTAAGVVDNAAVLIGVLDSNAAVAATDAASVVKFTRCTFGDNVTTSTGIVNHANSSTMEFDGCVFNTDSGMYSNAAATIDSTSFKGANAYVHGGGGTAAITIRNSTGVPGTGDAVENGGGVVVLGQPTGVTTITATDTITRLEHANRINLLGEVGGNAAVTLTLPAATGSGDIYKFVVSVVNTSNYVFKVADATDTIDGTIMFLADGGNTVVGFEADGTDDTITLDGTTTGGAAIGDYVELIDIAANQYAVRGNLTATGTEATPFSATVS
tara:strand:- start:1447 stop:2619 length:1173 start_codon:yes stop_codon:yes gene_type:complete